MIFRDLSPLRREREASRVDDDAVWTDSLVDSIETASGLWFLKLWSYLIIF